MNDSLKIQMDIKNNAQDLQNYILDLNNWEKEIRKKEMRLKDESPAPTDLPPPRNKIKRNKPSSEKPSSNIKAKKISAYDYSAWDKYDVDKACAELDEDKNSQNKADIQQITNEINAECIEENKSEGDDDDDDEDKLSLIDKALYEKELGNQYVKKEQWDNALRCYTNAINLDSKNPIYYANRSLCFLKLKNFRAAEVDATTAIQLDKDYVKAYQRRGFARLELGQNAEAKSDFEEVLRIEPKNSLMKMEINKIDKKLNKESKASLPKATFNPKNMFKKEEIGNVVIPSKPKASEEVIKRKEPEKSIEIISKDKKEIGSLKTLSSNLNKGDGDKQIPLDRKKMLSSVFKELPEHCNVIYPVQIPPHKRSKKPLRRINIAEVDEERNIVPSGDGLQNSPSIIAKHGRNIKTETAGNGKKEDGFPSKQKISLDIPKTSVQFRNCWNIIKNKPEQAIMYLKKVSGKLPQIFENSLESDLFSDLVTFLASDQAEKQLSVVYTFLLNLSNVKRFGSMILFMSKEDRACVKKCISELKSIKSENEISELLRLYEM